MRPFLQKILSNPSFQGQPISVVETLIVNFIDKNAAGLAPLFKSPDYYPNQTWEQTRALLLQELALVVIEDIKPRLQRAVSQYIDFTILNRLNNDPSFSLEDYVSQIWAFMDKIMVQKEVRTQLDAVG